MGDGHSIISGVFPISCLEAVAASSLPLDGSRAGAGICFGIPNWRLRERHEADFHRVARCNMTAPT
jgi:hypothetical protein